jgi:cellulose synthase/poly-beta-1,6-N-acetylglucosamine synthase-like glycosyltransferase
LTEYDALQLDISHVVEQTGRAAALKCFGFNGTGGVWRKEAIQAGGGWQWDTVTEDLDLSYLSHLRGGYNFVCTYAIFFFGDNLLHVVFMDPYISNSLCLSVR